MRSWNDKVKPGKGIDGNKDVGWQVKGNDKAANRRNFGGSMADNSDATSDEAK